MYEIVFDHYLEVNALQKLHNNLDFMFAVLDWLARKIDDSDLPEDDVEKLCEIHKMMYSQAFSEALL